MCLQPVLVNSLLKHSSLCLQYNSICKWGTSNSTTISTNEHKYSPHSGLVTMRFTILREDRNNSKIYLKLSSQPFLKQVSRSRNFPSKTSSTTKLFLLHFIIYYIIKRPDTTHKYHLELKMICA